MSLLPHHRFFSTRPWQIGALLTLVASTVHAADSTFIGNGTAAANYGDTANWQNGIVPGLGTATANPTAAQQNADIATFDSGTITQAQAITFAQNYSLGGFNFLAGSAAYTFGSGMSAFRFFFNTGGGVVMNAGAANTESLGRTGMMVGANGGTSTTYENDSTTTTAILTTSSFFNNNTTSGTVILTGTNTGLNSFATSTNAITNGSSTLSFVKNGTGTWNFGAGNASNTFTGGVTINNGTLRIAAGSGALNPIGSGTLAINGGTLGSINGANRTLANAFTLGAGAAFGDANGGTFTLNGAGTLTASTTLTANQATTINGVIGDGTTGTGFVLTKAGAATLALGGANTYRGGTMVTAGILSATTNGALGTGNVTVTGGVLSLAATVTDGIADNAILRLAGGGAPNTADTGAIELLGTTTETVKSLFLNGVAQQAGVYTSTTSADFITGPGSITVTTSPVPEPGTWALGLMAVGAVAGLRFRNRRQAA